MYKQAETGRKQENGDALGYGLNFHFISLRRSEGHSKTAVRIITMDQTRTINFHTLGTDIYSVCMLKKKKKVPRDQCGINAVMAATLKLVRAQA